MFVVFNGKPKRKPTMVGVTEGNKKHTQMLSAQIASSRTRNVPFLGPWIELLVDLD